MLISDTKKEFYDLICNTRPHVLILVSHDLDSIAAVKIVRYIFECDHIQHTIIPIRKKSELQRSYQEHRDSAKFVLLINLGATTDLLDLFMPERDVKIFVADSQRPLHVNNVYYDENVYILSTISGLCNIEDEFKSIPKYEQLFWDSDIEDDDDDIDVRTLSVEQLDRRNKFKQFERNRCSILADYLEYTRFTFSSALIFFDLAWKLGKDNNELLWLAILSVIDKEHCYKLEHDLWRKEQKYLYESMLRLRNIQSDRGLVINQVPGADESGHGELVTTTNHLSISYEKDLALRLYRQWSIYESMRHTMYISCKFKTWKVRGHGRLHTFLADLGMPLNQSKQKYQSMDLDLRRSLQQTIQDKMERYNLHKLISHTFFANRGAQQKFNAADLAAASRALLESPDKDRRYNEKFFDAYDSLSWSNTELMYSGIDLAKVQLVAIVKQVQLILDARMLSTMNNVLLYVIIPEGTPDEALFCHPRCLKTLAIYTLHAYVSFNHKSQKSYRLPLVFITPDPDRPGVGIACGLPPLLALKDCRTFFKQAFQNVSNQLSRVNPSWSFEESLVDPDIVYIPYAERVEFLNALSLLLEGS